MSDLKTPRPYDEWASDKSDRADDAACTFGYHLMEHCRSEVLGGVESKPLPVTKEEFLESVAAAVDHAIHNVMDLLEGFWRNTTGPNHTVEYALSVRVRDASYTIVEQISISPCLMDLPIGFWNWRDGEFRCARQGPVQEPTQGNAGTNSSSMDTSSST